MSTKTPWWQKKEMYPKLGDSALDCGWATTALDLEALEQGKVVYNNNIEGVLIAQDFDTVLRKFEDLGLRVVADSPPWRGDKCRRVFLVSDDTGLNLWCSEGDLEGRIVTTNRATFRATQEILEASIGPKASAGRAYVLMSTDEGPKLTSIGSAAVPLERANYNPEVLEGFDHIVRDLKSKSPSGRLAIFDGEPGTGKTYMIRGLLDAVPQALFVIVPVGMVQELASPGMIGALLETRRNKGDLPTVFLIEDADDCLGSRDATNVNAVSALLNLGDGILGAMMDLRLVCTTNLKNEELDEAVIRPGRLSRKVYVGPLHAPVAADLYKKLTGKDLKITSEMTLAEVYSAATHEGWKPVETKRPIGFNADFSVSELVDMKLDYGITEDELVDAVIVEEP